MAEIEPQFIKARVKRLRFRVSEIFQQYSVSSKWPHSIVSSRLNEIEWTCAVGGRAGGRVDGRADGWVGGWVGE